MNNRFYFLLAAVIMTALPLFAGWVPFIGEFIPKVLIMLYVLFFAPRLIQNKPFRYLVLFYLYVVLQSIALGYGIDMVTWFANFMDYAIPIFLLQAAIQYDDDKTVERLAKFSIIYIFVTVVLSIIVMSYDSTALRQQQALTVMGETTTVYLYKRQGLASYGFAAMIMCMPAVLISIYKSTSKKRIRLYAIIGIVLSLAFMWMGQVTTTLLICVFLTFVALFTKSFSSNRLLIGAALFMIFLGLFGAPILDAISPYTEGTAMESKFSDFEVVAHGGSVDHSDNEFSRGNLVRLTLIVFSNHPIFGDSNGYIGGHNYFLDRLALYGIVGVIPFFLMIFSLYKTTIRYLPNNKRGVYNLIFTGLMALGFLKNMPGIDYWLFIFCFYPFILKYSTRFDGK